MGLQAAVIQFPGSNCDQDAYRALESSGFEVKMHWHEEPIKKHQYPLVIVPGGFSFGDYLRAGAIAKLSVAAQCLEEVIEAGAHVMGICNGFQILLESRMLPGYLHVNSHLRFVSKTCALTVTEEAFPWIQKKDLGKTLKFPIAHRFGNYQVQKIDRGEVDAVLKYEKNPNGSFESVAGIYRKLGKGSVMGLMPHPERASFEALHLADGQLFWKNAKEALS